MRAIAALLFFTASACGLALGACGGTVGAPRESQLDRSGDCAAVAAAVAARTDATDATVTTDGTLYQDDGEDTYLPEDALHAAVPSITALAVRGNGVFLARVFRQSTDVYSGAAELVEIDANSRSGRCSTANVWTPTTADAFDRLTVVGDELQFLDHSFPAAIPLGGGVPTRLADTSVGAFVADDAVVVATVFTPSTGQKFDLLFGPRGGPLRNLGSFEGATTSRMIAQDDRFAYVATGIGLDGAGPVIAVDKKTGATNELDGFGYGCSEVVATAGALWGLCSNELVRRDASGASERVADIHGSAHDLVADDRAAFWVDAPDSPDRTHMRVLSLDALEARPDGASPSVAVVSDVRGGRHIALARDGNALYLAIETGSCTGTTQVGEGKAERAECATDRIAIRVERHRVPASH